MTSANSEKPVLLVIDASYVLLQQYHVVAKRGIAGDTDLFRLGAAVRATVERLARAHGAALSNVVMACDCPRSEVWRLKLHPEYKATRGSRRVDPRVFPFFYSRVLGVIRDALGARVVSAPAAEGDDVVAEAVAWAKESGAYGRVVVVTGDSDMAQLDDGRTVVVRDTSGASVLCRFCDKNGIARCGKTALELKLLCGDAGDNIPSAAARLGPKRAAALLRAHGTLGDVIAADEKLADGVRRNRALIDLSMAPAPVRSAIRAAILDTF